MIRKKRICLFLIIIIGLIAVSAVSAAEGNETGIVGMDENGESDLQANSNADILNVYNEDETLSAAGNFRQLYEDINGNNESTIKLDRNYAYDKNGDKAYEEGIAINRDVTIDGQGHTLDGSSDARIFRVIGSSDVVFRNINFNNGAAIGNGGALIGGTSINCTFKYNSAFWGGAIYEGNAEDCYFEGNIAMAPSKGGGAIAYGNATGCEFFQNKAMFCEGGAAMYHGTAVNCEFIENFASRGGGAILESTAVNCLFNANRVSGGTGGAAVNSDCYNCIFDTNSAKYGGAGYGGNYHGCIFRDNTAFFNGTGGALFLMDNNYAINCTFEYNKADNEPSAIYGGAAVNCTFVSNNCNNTKIYDYPTVVMDDFTCIYNSGDVFKYRIMAGDVEIYNLRTILVVLDLTYAPGVYRELLRVPLLSGNGWTVNITPGVYGLGVVMMDYLFIEMNSSNIRILNVTKIPTEILCDDYEYIMPYNSSEAFIENITLVDYKNSPISGVNITVELNGAENYTTDEDGKIRIPAAGIIPGNYAVNVTYESEFHQKSNVTINLTITNPPTRLSGNLTRTYNVTKTSENNLVVTFEYYDCNTQKYEPLVGAELSVDLNGVNKTYITNASGQINVPTDGFAAGNYTANVTFAGNEVYEKRNELSRVTINRARLHVYATYIVTSYNVETDFIVSLVDYDLNPVLGYNNVTIDLNGVKTYTTNETGQINISTKNLPAGRHWATIIFDGNENFTEETNYQRVRIAQDTTELSYNELITTQNSGENLTVSLKDSLQRPLAGLTLTVNFYGGEKNYTTDENGTIEVPVKDLEPSVYLAFVSFGGNENYTASAISCIISIIRDNTTVDVSEAILDNDVNITAIVDSGATGLVRFDISGPEEYTVYSDVVEGSAISRHVLTEGDYTVNATYMGDAYFNSNSTSKSFTVRGHVKRNTTITSNVDVDNCSVTITATVDSNATGYVTVALLGQTFIVPVKDGKAVFAYDFNPGTYTADVTYLGDDDFNNATAQASFTVTQQIAELKNTTVSVDVATADNDVTLTAEVNAMASGLVEFSINGKAVYIAVNNGKAVYTTSLPAGDYNVAVTYMGDSRFNANRTSKAFTVMDHIKRNTTINSDVAVYEYRVFIGVDVDKDATGFVEFKLNENIIYVNVDDGKAVMEDILYPGEYTVRATYLGDDDFNANTTDITFTVEEIQLKDTDVNAEVYVVENNVTITVNIDEDATGFVEFNISGAENYTVYVKVDSGVAVLEDVLIRGDYRADITYLGDLNFNMNSTAEEFTVSGHVKRDTPILIGVEVEAYTVTITAGVDENATGFVEYNIAGKSYYEPVKGGRAVLISDFLAGSYMGNVHYLGDENFNEAVTLVLFNVLEQNVSLMNTTLDVIVSSHENDVSIVAVVNSSATGLVEVIVGDTVVYLPLDNGEAGYEIMLPGGEYNVTVTYLGDARFNPNSTVREFVVYDHIKMNTTINCDVSVNDHTVAITANVNDLATGFVEFNIAGQKYYAPVDGGKAVLISDFLTGNYMGNVFYMGDDNFNGAATLVSFNVLEQNVSLMNTTLDVIVSSRENDVSIVAVINSSATGLMEFAVDDEVVYLPVNNGEAGYEIMLPGGEYSVRVTYLGDARFNSNSTVKEFVVYDRIKLNTTVNCDVGLDESTVALTVNVNSAATGFVEINIAGKTYYAPVNDGKAVFVSDFLPGTYAGNVHYLGDENFNEASTLVFFTVTERNDTLMNTTIEVIVSSRENDVSIVAVVDSSATGLVEIAVGEDVVYVALNNGEAGYELVLPGGEYSVTATYLGDARFNPNSTVREFVVYDHIKSDTSINCNVSVDVNTVSITVTVDDLATGFVEFNIAGQKYYAPVEDGNAVLITDFLTGNYMGNAHYLGDGNFNEALTFVYFAVAGQTLNDTPIDATVEINENNVTITAGVDPEATGFVEFDVDGAENYTVYVAVEDGKAILEDVLTTGDYSVRITYLGDSKFNANTTIVSFTVAGHIRKNTTITAVPAVDGTTVTVTAVVDSNATGYVTIAVLGQTFIVPVNDGKAVFTYDFFPGTYSANVVYLGDDNFNGAGTTVSFTVIRKEAELKNTAIDVDVESMENDVTITAKVNESATGLVEFIINGKAVYIALNNGEAVYDVVLAGGDYNVTVTYLGDDRFNPNSTSESFTVSDHVKSKTKIRCEVDIDGYDVTLTATVNETGATGFVEFSIAGKTYYAPVENGKAILSSDFLAGTYMGNVRYLGDDNFMESLILVSFTVTEQHADLKNTTIEVDVSSVGNDVSVFVNVDADATGLVEFVIGEEVVYIPVNNGVAVYSTVLAAGDYTVDVTYLGDSRFNANSTSEAFTVEESVKLNTTINCDVGIDENTVAVTANVDSEATGFVEFVIAGKRYYAPVENGKATLVSDFLAGTYMGNVHYLGDENFNEAVTLVSFTVTEQNVTLKNTTLEVIVSSDENDVSIVAVVDSSATGLVEIAVGDNVVYVALNNGEAGYETVLPAGEYSVTVTYLGDSRFNPNSTVKEFVVFDHIKLNTTVSCDVAVDENTVTLTANVDSRATGFVEINIAGKRYYAPVEDGKAVFTSDFLAGTYAGNVHYLGDENFNEATTLVFFTVTEQNVTLKNTTIDVDVSSVGNDVSVFANVNADATGLVEFKIGEEVVYIPVNNGIAVYTTVLAAGNYTVDVTYLGDLNYNPNSTSKTFKVEESVKLNTTINCDVVIDENTVAVTANVDSEATGFVEFVIAGKRYYAPVENGKATLVSDFLAGTYMGNVHYLGDENFNEAVTLVSFTVTEQNVTLKNTTVDVIVSSHENDVSIVAVVDSSATGLVEIAVGDDVVYVAVNNGEAGYETVLPAGEYNVSVTYLGDVRFNPNSTVKEFVVYDHIKGNTTVSCDVAVDENTVTLTVNVDSRATGFVEINIAGKRYYAPVEDGKAVFASDFLPGTYAGNIRYLGDENFNEAATLVFFSVTEQNVTLKNTTVEVIVSSHENDVSIVAVVNSSATGLVEISVGGNAVYVAVNNGEAGYETVLPGGEYNVTVTYLGDSRFNPNSTVKSFVVYDHIRLNTTVNCDVAVVENTVTLTVNVDSNATGFVEINIAGKKYYASVEDGKAILVSDFPAGNYMGNIHYLGDENFNEASTLLSFTVAGTEKMDTKFIDIRVSDGTLTARLVDELGTPVANANVTYTIRGVETALTTTADGLFTVKDALGNVIAIRFAGDDALLATGTTVSLDDGPVAPARLGTVIIADDFEQFSCDHSIGERGGYFIGQLKDSNGNPLANRTVWIGYNGITFNRTTNETGHFAVQIGLQNAGLYTFAMSYLGDDGYNASFLVRGINIIKKPTSIVAKDKKFKAKTKTKKLTVKLTTIVGSSIDGKVYLKAGKKLTLKVNGKKYKAKTDANGRATFKITNLKKKATYVAKVSFAGDKFVYDGSSKKIKLIVK